MALAISVETDQKTSYWPSYQRTNPAAGTFYNLRYFKKLENIENLGHLPKNFYTRIYVVFYFFKMILISQQAYFLIILTITARLSRYGHQGGGRTVPKLQNRDFLKKITNFVIVQNVILMNKNFKFWQEIHLNLVSGYYFLHLGSLETQIGLQRLHKYDVYYMAF